jgi:hypothetical protein
MAKVWSLCVIGSLWLVGCKIPEHEAPNDIINDSLMKAVLLDIYLAEGARSGGQRMFDERVIDDYYQMIFEKHKIDSIQFRTSFDFYSAYPNKMAEIHDKLVRKLMEIDAQKAALADSSRKKLQEESIHFEDIDH